MTREEAIEQLKNIKSAPSMFIDETIKELVETLKQPPTLCDFLGWEEGQEYEYRTVDILMLDNGKIYIKNDMCPSGWCNYTFFGNQIEDLRQAKKVEPKKYYAKIKIDMGKKYLFTHEETIRSGKKASSIRDERYVKTKQQWAELGINDRNADFEEVE